MTREFLVVGESHCIALCRLRQAIVAYVKRRSFGWHTKPEAQRYEGRNKALQGKWRAYARIKVI